MNNEHLSFQWGYFPLMYQNNPTEKKQAFNRQCLDYWMSVHMQKHHQILTSYYKQLLLKVDLRPKMKTKPKELLELDIWVSLDNI